MEFFDDLDNTVAENVDWGDSSDEEKETRTTQMPGTAEETMSELAKKAHAVECCRDDSGKDAGEVGGSSGDYTHPAVEAWLQEKARNFLFPVILWCNGCLSEAFTCPNQKKMIAC